MTLDVLYEDNHLLVVNKPPGIATMGGSSEEDSMVTLAKEYLKWKYDKPGNVYLGVVSRLDRPVTGVLVFARTSKSAGRLTTQFSQRGVEKTYWALASRLPEEDCEAGRLEDWLTKSESQRKIIVARSQRPPAQPASLSYRLLDRFPRAVLLEIDLETGRKHQIRVQLGSRDAAVLGDERYGSVASFPQGIALHARRLRLVHPTRKEPLTFCAPLPGSWHDWARSRGVARSIERWDRVEVSGD